MFWDANCDTNQREDNYFDAKAALKTFIPAVIVMKGTHVCDFFYGNWFDS